MFTYSNNGTIPTGKNDNNNSAHGAFGQAMSLGKQEAHQLRRVNLVDPVEGAE